MLVESGPDVFQVEEMELSNYQDKLFIYYHSNMAESGVIRKPNNIGLPEFLRKLENKVLVIEPNLERVVTFHLFGKGDKDY